MTPFLHMARNKQIVLPGKWPATESFIFYTALTEIEMTCTFVSKSQRGLSKSKAKVCYTIPPCKHTIKGGVESSSAFFAFARHAFLHVLFLQKWNKPAPSIPESQPAHETS